MKNVKMDIYSPAGWKQAVHERIVIDSPDRIGCPAGVAFQGREIRKSAFRTIIAIKSIIEVQATKNG